MKKKKKKKFSKKKYWKKFIKKVNRSFCSGANQSATLESWTSKKRSTTVNSNIGSIDCDARAINVLSAFSPTMVTNFLTNPDYTSVLEPFAKQMTAALLFVDMSGFTPLTERLSKRGLRGVEELSDHLNKYFGGMVQEINSHGGDVLKFVGDALIILFHEENMDLNRC